MPATTPLLPTPPPIVLATLNARYIHASLGLRYLLANMARHGGLELRRSTLLREYTINKPAQGIVDDLLLALQQTHPDSAPPIVGFGVYIWNVVQTTQVVRLLKTLRPDVRVVLGGPEVSHELDSQPIVALADYVITGWGDVSFPKLCHALVYGPRPLMKVIAGEQPSLAEVDLPYAAFSAEDLKHRLLYVEASRGCPFKCEFCLSALDKTAWAFDEDLFLAELHTLFQRGARNFKFVDRTFNLKIDASIRILQFFLDRLSSTPTEPLFLHFEVVPDHLPDRLKAHIARFPAGVLQFEIGIQSFNADVQQRVSRRQDNARTEANLHWLLQHSQAHLHTDLIFGLPGETWASFAAGFDRLYAIGPHEIQLGVLKRLRGTPLAQRSAQGAVPQWGMVYDPLPPYTVQHTDAVTAGEVSAFVRVARYWDLVANSGRFGTSMALLMAGPSAFASFAAFAQWLWARCGLTHGLSPEQLVDHVFEYLCTTCALPAITVRNALVSDYVASGARAQPACLRGHLPARNLPRNAPLKTPTLAPSQGFNQRQQRHGSSANSSLQVQQASKIAP